MKYVLREYQEKFVTGLGRKLLECRKIIGQLATGGGKTIVFSAISNRYIQKSKKGVLIAVHRKELLEQTRRTAYNAFGLECQPIVAGMRYIPPADVYVAMVESLYRRMELMKKMGVDLGLLIIDECHRLEFMKVMDKARELWPDILIIGFTATPLSASKKKPLKMFYDDIVCGIDIPDLIKLNSLCQNITWAPKETVDRLELTMKGDDFDDAAMANAFSKPKYIHNTVGAYERWGLGKKTIVFNVNIFHSKEVTKAFQAKGYNCRHLDGEMGDKERDEILHWFAVTPDAILCNVGIATTGFDEPTIEIVIVNKATMSMPLWLQMCGRGSRPLEWKRVFTIIDMGGNAIAHGDWCNPRDWYKIFHEPPKPGKATAAPAKSCPSCDAIVPASTRTCPHCGYEWPRKEIAIEAELYDFVMVTKGIDVAELVKQNQHRKQYYPFYRIGSDLARDAKKTIPVMQEEYFTFILQKYFELAKEWTHTQKKRFNKWHQERAQEHLIEQLKIQFPKWQPSPALLASLDTV